MPIGTAIDRRYVVLGPVGYGGVSVVYQATDARQGRTIALKLLAPRFADDPDARRKVYTEAQLTDRLCSPGVPRVYAYGDARLRGCGTVPYVSMELLRGAVLAGRLAGGPLPWAEAVRVAATVADVLAVAHRRGVVHRDLTAHNVMLTGTGPKIVDFGAARRVGSGGHPTDDVYALGVLLYQMLTGRSPYHAPGTAPGLDLTRWYRLAPTPVLLVPGLPRAVAEICRGCMAKRVQERPGSDQVALDLWAVLDGRRGDCRIAARCPVLERA
ncbi:MAG TPA: serine/threonine-protein kinase [Rugosimonospora sp.]|nr:serine/threonine-protein kinase [Rugosimonospora sp.]